jgi:hypothetical protein
MGGRDPVQRPDRAEQAGDREGRHVAAQAGEAAELGQPRARRADRLPVGGQRRHRAGLRPLEFTRAGAARIVG